MPDGRVLAAVCNKILNSPIELYRFLMVKEEQKYMFLSIYLSIQFAHFLYSTSPTFPIPQNIVTLTLLMSTYSLSVLYKVALFCCLQLLIVQLFTPVRSWIKSYGRLFATRCLYVRLCDIHLN